MFVSEEYIAGGHASIRPEQINHGIENPNPEFRDAYITPSKNCSTCKFYKNMNMLCKRYPEEKITNSTNWCGEYKFKDSLLCG